MEAETAASIRKILTVLLIVHAVAFLLAGFVVATVVQGYESLGGDSHTTSRNLYLTGLAAAVFSFIAAALLIGRAQQATMMVFVAAFLSLWFLWPVLKFFVVWAGLMLLFQDIGPVPFMSVGIAFYAFAIVICTALAWVSRDANQTKPTPINPYPD